MNFKIYILLLISLFSVNKTQAQCPSNYIKHYTTTTNLVEFTDFTNIPANWHRDYTEWDYNDGSPIDTGLITSHTFPSAITYTVTKTTKLSEIGNPSNFCLATSIFLVNASLSNPNSICYPSVGFKVKWLTGLTFGVSSYVSGCPSLFKEIAIDSGYYTNFGSGGPVPGIYSTNQSFFTYTFPYQPYVYSFVHHLNISDPNNFGGFTPMYVATTIDSIPLTPADCFASFFMQPADSTLHNWTIQDYSSSAGTPSYFWDFGDGTTSTLSTPTHTYATTNMYTVCLTVSDGTCSNTYCNSPMIDTTQLGHGVTTLNVQKMIATGITENKKQELPFSLFPNPAHNSIDIFYPFKKENYTITVTDLLGQQVLNQQSNDLSTSTIRLNIEGLKSGMYLLQIHSDSGTTLAKTRFIKE